MPVPRRRITGIGSLMVSDHDPSAPAAQYITIVVYRAAPAARRPAAAARAARSTQEAAATESR